MNEFINFIQSFGQFLLIAMGICLVLAIVLLFFAVRQMRRIAIPDDADLTTTLLSIPLIVVLGIDLLDFALDFLALPFVWLLLDRMRLRALRNVSAVEALIPFTQPIPTLTVAWLAVRMGIRF